ncbi:MAG: flagellar filament capping protein FliD [Acidobacteriia bacterium]|nr:flagellar filament capping protein FliD [Terriglobia bacterium]
MAIASLPITLLNNQQNNLTNQSNELTTLDTLFGKLQTAVQGINDAMSGSSFQATYSSPSETDASSSSVVNATLANGATEGVYSINVDTIGSYAANVSAQTWNSTPAANGGMQNYTLVVGSQEYKITPSTTDNSAQTVAAAINAQYGNLVQATAVNVGSATAPDYRISLQSTTLGPMKLDLVQTPANAQPTSLQASSAPAAYSSSLTAATWDPTGGSFSLVVNGVSEAITTSDDSAQGVAAAINSEYGSQVQATVVNNGTSSSPDYRISLQSATPGTPTLDITNSSGASLQTQGSAISYSTSQTAGNWDAAPDAAGSRSMYTLVVGSNTYNFAAADNSAATIAATINSQFGNMVQATVANGGISLRSVSAGSSMTLDIQKSTAVSYQNQQTTGTFAATAGTLAQYEVDGGAPVQSNTRAVNVSTGVTLNLLGTGTTSVTVTQSSSALNTALSSFADAYNAIVDELGKQRGLAAGPLAGQSIVYELSGVLSQISTYSAPSGQVNTLQSLGLNLDVNGDGHLTYDPSSFLLTDSSNSAGIASLLGSPTSGGFLQSVTTALNNVEDPNTGLLKTAESNTANQIANIGAQISTKQTQVSQLQTTLTQQMAAADALIASMEQQYSYLTGMFQAQQTAAASYK